MWPQTFQGVLTGQYDNNRSGANLQETTLTPSNVSPGAFGLLFSHTVDAPIFAQPLYVPNLTINGQLHNVAFAATMNNSVYAFDADTLQAALWHVSLGTPIIFGGAHAGIVSTPVIDAGLNTMFLVTITTSNGTQAFTLWALNLLTGQQIAQVAIQGAVPGTGDDSQSTPCTSGNGTTVPPPCIPFVTPEQMQRPALLEDPTQTVIYIAFGTRNGAEATTHYHGWLFGYQYNGGAFTQTMVFNTTPSATQTGQACSSATPPTNQCGHGGGIWMSGRGPAMDSNGIYVVTGNGGFGGKTSGNWGESVLRLNTQGVVQDSFTPSNYATLNQHDLDLGDAGVILFNSTNAAAQSLLVGAGKTGNAYLLNRAGMGGIKAGNTGGLQSFTAASAGCGTGPGQSGCYEIHSAAVWPRVSANPILYVWALGDTLRSWDFNPATNQFTADPDQGSGPAPNYPGGGLAISANGDSNGILWAIVPLLAAGKGQEGALYAYDATDVSTPLWSSTDYWFATRFTIPTVANGKVYVPTSASQASISPSSPPQLLVYGLCTGCPQ